MTAADLLLVGAGHAHLHLVTRAAELRVAGYRVRLLAPGTFRYSGVASATAAGTLPTDVGQIDVSALARAHDVEHVEGTLAGIDLATRSATTSTGLVLDYDVLSLNLGSVVASHAMEVDPAVVRVKPLVDLGRLSNRLSSAQGRRAVVTVVGGGATGLEMAAHLATHDDVSLVRIVEAGPNLGPDLPASARRRLLRLLADRGVESHVGLRVAAIEATQLRCEDGLLLGHDVALLATGLVAPRLVADLGLGDIDGVPVRATLQHIDHDEIYAVGDCAHFLPSPLPRVGVHGVRQAPILLRSLIARREGEVLPVYEPRRFALAVLDLGGGVGLAVRGRWWLYGPSALALKRWLDRRWLRQYV